VLGRGNLRNKTDGALFYVICTPLALLGRSCLSLSVSLVDKLAENGVLKRLALCLHVAHRGSQLNLIILRPSETHHF